MPPAWPRGGIPLGRGQAFRGWQAFCWPPALRALRRPRGQLLGKAGPLTLTSELWPRRRRARSRPLT
eukprot:4635028-Pyramimonas_sp.AAC.1